MATELEIAIDLVGPDERSLQQFSRTLMVHPRLQEQLSNADFRLLSFELIDPAEKSDQPPPPDRYRATLCDYTGNRTLFAEGSMRTPDVVEITESGIQPLPSAEEFAAAVDVLSQHDEIGTLLREQVARPYQPMPPLLQEELPDGRVERTITVGLLPVGDRDVHEIVGVNLITRAVVRFPNRAPATATAGGLCGLPPAGQPTASQGTPGQVWVTVSQAGTVLWRFLVVRPAASSGANGSGVELRFVDYRGKRLLYRAHVPILNVKYSAPPCGPYLDWQYAEGMIQATGGDVAPGFRLCPTPAQTILDTGDDKGNFLGVAIYVDGEEVVLVSELQAGWYRYISMWRTPRRRNDPPPFWFLGNEQRLCVHGP